MSVDLQPSLRPFLERLQSRSALTDAECEAILALPFEVFDIEANRDIIRRGETTSASCFIASGMVGAFKQDRQGVRQNVAIYITNDMVDLHSVPLPEAIATLHAILDTRLLKVPHEPLRRIAREHRGIAEAFWRETVVDNSILMEWVFNVGRRQAKARLAHFLCELAYRSTGGEPPHEFVIPFEIPQQHLSEMLGLTAVHINRTLRALREEGLLDSTGRSQLRIRDWDGLAQSGDFNPSYLHLKATVPASG